MQARQIQRATYSSPLDAFAQSAGRYQSRAQMPAQMRPVQVLTGDCFDDGFSAEIVALEFLGGMNTVVRTY